MISIFFELARRAKAVSGLSIALGFTGYLIFDGASILMQYGWDSWGTSGFFDKAFSVPAIGLEIAPVTTNVLESIVLILLGTLFTISVARLLKRY
jgi:ABC-type phosphate/phosphonate transport system permease subunit